MRRRLSLAALGLCISQGCSYAFVEPPPPDADSRTWFDCTSGRAAPVLDVGAAAYLALSSLVVLAYTAGDSNKHEGQVVAGLAGVAAIASGASAIYGFQTTAECDEAEQRRDLRLLEPAAVPAPAPPSEPALDPDAGCASNADCKAPRVCLSRRCAWP